MPGLLVDDVTYFEGVTVIRLYWAHFLESKILPTPGVPPSTPLAKETSNWIVIKWIAIQTSYSPMTLRRASKLLFMYSKP